MMQNPTSSAPPVDMGSFPFVFRPSVAIPQFCVAYRWWEDEAINMLWAYDFNDISQAIRFGLFHDETSPRSSLLSRNMQFINEFLLAASKPYEHCRLSDLSHPQKVEEILLRSSIPQRPLLTWNWIPTISGGSSDPRTIALEIEAESYSHFQQIAFEDIVRSALGYKAMSVEWFLQQHTSLYGILVNHLHIYPEELLLYLEVEKHNMPSRNTPGFAFIAAPIQQLFKTHSSSLSTIFKVLSVLAVRFQKAYRHSDQMNWFAPFETSLPLLEDCLYSSATDLATALTQTDKCLFERLSRETLIAEDAMVLEPLIHWQVLSNSVLECCSGLSDLVPYLQTCTLELYEARNYYSLMAILDGLCKYIAVGSNTFRAFDASRTVVTPTSLIPAKVLPLIDPSHNFASYRKRYDQHPGIPFLQPHIRESKQCGKSAQQPLLRLFQAITSSQREDNNPVSC
ncbi:Pc24g01700 [Penicillium rubens Wisconsin 54-1255]|uniref:Pc24g01700 protein n=1 Tax=Penicillium rubens (strain ATCC 28089 / DSM 1075 / NRRL 1951 / Wisconsin 54-1255) TaxID=500485 RepID=B6HWV9_PENRW|nr:Pc24g01700 [Penicillium rubens Wisconsin 54-1255]